MEVQNLAVHHDLPRIARQVGLVERPVERLVCLWLVRRVVVGLEEGVGETVAGVDSGFGVVDEHLGEQVDGWRRRRRRRRRPREEWGSKAKKRAGDGEGEEDERRRRASEGNGEDEEGSKQ
jgi:hypothetical protein